MSVPVYRRDFKILASDVDMYRRLRLSRLFTILEQAAVAHTESLGFGRDKTLDRGYLWVVMVQEAEIARLPVYDENVTVFSEPGKMVHMLFPRFCTVADESGNTLISARSTWALMDASARSLADPEKAGVVINGTNDGSPLFAQPPLPAGGETTKFRVPYSYTDINGHMNNARYLDLAQDLMPRELLSRDVKRIAVSYASEAKYGLLMDIKTRSDNESFIMCGSPAADEADGETATAPNAAPHSRANKPIFRLKIDYNE